MHVVGNIVNQLHMGRYILMHLILKTIKVSSNFGQTLSYSSKSDKIVIGAPDYPGGGAVFECHLPENYFGGSLTPDRDTSYSSTCNRLFETQKYDTNASYDSSNEQLGSSILVTKKGDTIACAPRFKINLQCVKNQKSTSCDIIKTNADVKEQSEIAYAMPGR